MAARDRARHFSRRALFLLLACARSPVAGLESTTVLFADEGWYRERSEPEQERTGVLRKRQVTTGPNSRSAVRYTFHVAQTSFLVYAPAKVEEFDKLLGKRVTARGKLVDLRAEGFGEEFWIASVRH